MSSGLRERLRPSNSEAVSGLLEAWSIWCFIQVTLWYSSQLRDYRILRFGAQPEVEWRRLRQPSLRAQGTTWVGGGRGCWDLLHR
jgi:hypothetical protein